MDVGTGPESTACATTAYLAVTSASSISSAISDGSKSYSNKKKRVQISTNLNWRLNSLMSQNSMPLRNRKGYLGF